MSAHNRAALQLFINRLLSRSTLDPAEIEFVLDWPGEIRTYSGNHDLVGQGTLVSSACLVIEGRVGRYEQTTDGDRQIAGIYLPGDMPDLHSVMIPRVSSGLQALTRCTILHVPHRAILDGAEAHSGILAALWRDTTADAFILSQWLLNNGRRGAKSRIAHLFCELAVRGEAQGHSPDRIDLQLTQIQIADALGLTSVHVNRMMRSLTEDGVIRTVGRAIEVLDRERLMRIGDFNPGYLHLAPSRDR